MKKLTSAQVEEMVELYKSSEITLTALAQKYSVSIGAIKGLLMRRSIEIKDNFHKLDSVQKKNILSDYENGLSSIVIAKKYGVSKPSILGLLKRKGVEVRHPTKPSLGFLAVLFPDIAQEWHPTKNSLSLAQIKPYSSKKVWWRCSTNQAHEWEAVIAARTHGETGCPHCFGNIVSSNNNLAVKYPELIREWNYSRNEGLLPHMFLPMSNRKVWWICQKDLTHEWQTIIYDRTRGESGCPFCSNYKVSATNNLAVMFPDLAKEWHATKNGDLTPDQVTGGTRQKVWWQCKNYINHEWLTSVYDRTITNHGCPKCAWNHTKLEKFVEEKLEIEKYSQNPLSKSHFRPDFKLTEDLYLNVDGLYWHSEINREKDYHFKLREAFQAENKQILQFYEDEIYNKWSIVESIINARLGKIRNKINARECEIVALDQETAQLFHEQNHFMGHYGFAYHFGLTYNSDLISVISVRNVELTMEIARFSSKIICIVRG
jgi:predicted DNA-binding protein YlxM (UPF0122 family)